MQIGAKCLFCCNTALIKENMALKIENGKLKTTDLEVYDIILNSLIIVTLIFYYTIFTIGCS